MLIQKFEVMNNEYSIFARRDDIAQGTPAWHEWRATVIGSSDAPTIMGENPWKSAKALLEEKLGIRARFLGNAATRRGNALEPRARSIYEKLKGIGVEPAILQNKIHPWQAASVDGIDRAGTVIVEIKCGIKSYEYTAKTGSVSPYYYGQLQHILAVSGLPSIDYFCYTPGNKELFYKVLRNEPYINRLLSAEQEFRNLLINHGISLAKGSLHHRSAVRTTAPPGKDKAPTGYSGEKFNGKFHGQGTYIWPNGDKYVGEWRNGALHGHGTCTWANGHRYVGEWTFNERTGVGTYFLPDGRIYSGYMIKGTYHGPGEIKYPDGSKYSGEWKANHFDGQGTSIGADSSSYIGDWKNGARHGHGTFLSPSGEKYVGEWNNNERTGIGIHYLTDGRVYNGKLINGKRDGKGTMRWPDGSRYVGEWDADQRHGNGTMTDADGTEYVGAWRRDLKEGHGRQIWANGSQYIGDWKAGNLDGQGKCTWSNGSIYDGQWKKGKRHGTGSYFFESGKLHPSKKWKDNEPIISRIKAPSKAVKG